MENTDRNEKKLHLLFAALHAVVGYLWLSSGSEKIASGDFPARLPSSLAFFASKNPFPAVKNFLTGAATDNASMFGSLVQYGEVAIGAALILGALMLALFSPSPAAKRLVALDIFFAMLAGMALAATFYLAAGWTGPGTHSLNILLFWTHAVFAVFWLHIAGTKDNRATNVL